MPHDYFSVYTDENEIDLEFLNATQDTIQAGDKVLTVFGWQAIINRVYSKLTCGQIGYSVTPCYTDGHGCHIPQPVIGRRWIFDSEIVLVIS
jgi:hypothetical protein